MSSLQVDRFTVLILDTHTPASNSCQAQVEVSVEVEVLSAIHRVIVMKRDVTGYHVMKRDMTGYHALVALSGWSMLTSLVQLPRVAGEDHDQREDVLVKPWEVDA